MKPILIAHVRSVGTALVHSLSNKLDKDIVVVNNVNELPKLLSENNSYTITNPYHDLPEIKAYGQSKPFICKGKHEYREINGKWICECGKQL